MTKSLCLTFILTYWAHEQRLLTRYIQDYFRTFVKCAHEIGICAYTFETNFNCTTFLLRNPLILFVTSSPVNFSSSPTVQCKLSLLSCFVSIASNSSLHNSALHCAITELKIFRKQEINSFSVPSGTLMDCLKFYIFTKLLWSKTGKIKNCFHTSRQTWIHLLKIIHLFFMPGKHHYEVFKLCYYSSWP